MKSKTSLTAFGTLVFGLGLSLIPGVLAHGDEADEPMAMDTGADTSPHAHGPSNSSSWETKPAYFSHPEHASLMYGHMALMFIGWCVVLPIAVMLSLARSRYTMISQFTFLGFNVIGVVLGAAYNAQTPDLYPNNAHHKIGWIITWVVAVQIMIGLVGRAADAVSLRYESSSTNLERQAFMSLPMSPNSFNSDCRFSHDSGQGTEPRTESLRSASPASDLDEEGLPMPSPDKEYDEEADLETIPLSSPLRKGRFAAKAAKVVGSRIWKYFTIVYSIIDRVILPFGFVALATGVLTYARFFDGRAVFGGLAHWIKGGVFFWLGLFTLGRWSGSFAELGWAWNLRTEKKNWRPTSEFVESFLICFYGCTNIFLEHLGARKNGEWSAQDMEHISITVLFIGGGACGMLIESSWIRNLLNTTAQGATEKPRHPRNDEEREQIEEPKTYGFSMNPIPALVILLLGIMMTSHKQKSMISTMVHAQWGNLLAGASLARALTYMLMWLKPPTSILPSRPPTELLASFGLISGGIMFMASSSDCVRAMEVYDVDEMFMYTVTMGFIGLLMAWEIVLLAVKGWAVRHERHARLST